MENDPNILIEKRDYSIVIFSGRINPIEEIDDNIDVQVNMSDGKYYSATIFTLQNVHSLFDKNKLSGECDSGLYFSCPDMVIVEKLSVEVVERLVDHLVETRELETVFKAHSE